MIDCDVVIEGYEYCMPLGRAFNTLMSVNYNLFILTVEIIEIRFLHHYRKCNNVP